MGEATAFKLNFTAAMDQLGPFEDSPVVAVAVSGGADSLALCLMVQEWAKAQAGKVIALIVDHDLRPESAAEAQWTREFLAERGVEAYTLKWEGHKPITGVQEAAREARLALLEAKCKELGILHLCLGHHRQDQAETFIMRAEAKSGILGLSGMAAVRELKHVRLLRPLLGTSKQDLQDYLKACGVNEWVEDPSNQQTKYQRVQVRQGLDTDGIAQAYKASRGAGKVRKSVERVIASYLADSVQLSQLGYAEVDLSKWDYAKPEVCLQVLARVVGTVGSRKTPLRREQVHTMVQKLQQLKGAATFTLGGCVLLAKPGELLVCREQRGQREPLLLKPNNSVVWDNRFRVETGPKVSEGVAISALGEKGWQEVTLGLDKKLVKTIPLEVKKTLPAVVKTSGEGVAKLLGAPHLNYWIDCSLDIHIHWYPLNPLTTAGFHQLLL